MFKMFRTGRNAPRLLHALQAAKTAIDTDHMDAARDWITQAYNLSLDTTFFRTQLIDLVLGWGLLSEDVAQHGDTALADQCRKMRQLLQARLDAGDYYRELDGPILTRWRPNRGFKFHKRSQLFIGTHNKTLSVAVRVNDPDCSPMRING